MNHSFAIRDILKNKTDITYYLLKIMLK